MDKVSVIPILVHDINDVLDPFDPLSLSLDLDTYIMNKCSIIPVRNNIVFKVSFYGLDQDRQSFKRIMHDHYQKHLSYNLLLDKLDDRKRFFLLILGILFIIVSRIITVAVLSEVLLISGWVAVWEMVYDLLFNEMKRKISVKRFRHLVNSKIEFV